MFNEREEAQYAAGFHDWQLEGKKQMAKQCEFCDQLAHVNEEFEALKRKFEEVVKQATAEQQYEASEMNKCGNDGDDWGYGVHAGKYTAYQYILDIANGKEGDNK